MGSIFDDIKGEFHKSNNAVIKLILMNVLIFVAVTLVLIIFKLSQQVGLHQLVTEQLLLPADFHKFIYKPWTLLTNVFVHISPFHLFFNMLTLYWFGRVLEEYLGSRRLLAIYILGGLAGGVLFLLMYNFVPYFQQELQVTLLGASGAIFAIILAAATLIPDYTFFVIFIGPVRLKYIAAFFILISLAQLLGPNTGGNLAHLAGGMVGFGFIKALQAGYDWGAPIYAIGRFFERLTSPRPRVEVPQRERAPTTNASSRRYTSASESSANTVPNQDEIDAILDKITKSGYASLTREEKQKLYRASQQQ